MSNASPRSFTSRLHRALDPRANRIRAQLDIERERIDRLEAELAELRRDSLRVAELTDLIEGRLTPPADKQ